MKIYMSTGNKPSFEDFAGQPVWVKVKDTSWGDICYIMIVSLIGDDEAEYKLIPDYFIDNDGDYCTDLLQGIENKVHRGSLVQYQIEQPLQVFSDFDLGDQLYYE